MCYGLSDSFDWFMIFGGGFWEVDSLKIKKNKIKWKISSKKRTNQKKIIIIIKISKIFLIRNLLLPFRRPSPNNSSATLTSCVPSRYWRWAVSMTMSMTRSKRTAFTDLKYHRTHWACKRRFSPKVIQSNYSNIQLYHGPRIHLMPPFVQTMF